MHRRTFAAFVLASMLPLAAGAAPAQNIDKRGVAIKGYDPVAYFAEYKPVKGNPAISARIDSRAGGVDHDRRGKLARARGHAPARAVVRERLHLGATDEPPAAAAQPAQVALVQCERAMSIASGSPMAAATCASAKHGTLARTCAPLHRSRLPIGARHSA